MNRWILITYFFVVHRKVYLVVFEILVAYLESNLTAMDLEILDVDMVEVSHGVFVVNVGKVEHIKTVDLFEKVEGAIGERDVGQVLVAHFGATIACVGQGAGIH